MARRYQDWEEGLSHDLNASKKNRKEFFLALLEEGYGWREAINKIVKLIGVNEYAELIGDMKASNLLNQLKPESNITIKTLDKITAPLGIELTFKEKG
jgi:hypothetical protein